MSNALTLDDMSPGLLKVVGRESPRATSAEEPDAGNPLVRIWRGAGLGNRPAYSTTLFCRAAAGSSAAAGAGGAAAHARLVAALRGVALRGCPTLLARRQWHSC